MMTTFDLFFRDFFREDSMFLPQTRTTKVYHPVDIFEKDNKLIFEVACTGISKEDVKVEIQGDTVRVKYERKEEDGDREFLFRSIARRSFNLGWKVSSKYDPKKAKASFENGLLKIEMPLSEEGTVNILPIE